MKRVKYRVVINTKSFEDVLLKKGIKLHDEIQVDNVWYTVSLVSNVNLKGVPKIWLGVTRGVKCKYKASVTLFPMNMNEAVFPNCSLFDGHSEPHVFLVE